MSSFGSSVINKSSKKFAPKVAARRRPGAAAAALTDTPSSTDQTPADTPQNAATPAEQPPPEDALPTPPTTQVTPDTQPDRDVTTPQTAPELSQAPLAGSEAVPPSTSPAPTLPAPVVTTHGISLPRQEDASAELGSDGAAVEGSPKRPREETPLQPGNTLERSPKRQRIEALLSAQSTNPIEPSSSDVSTPAIDDPSDQQSEWHEGTRNPAIPAPAVAEQTLLSTSRRSGRNDTPDNVPETQPSHTDDPPNHRMEIDEAEYLQSPGPVAPVAPMYPNAARPATVPATTARGRRKEPQSNNTENDEQDPGELSSRKESAPSKRANATGKRQTGRRASAATSEVEVSASSGIIDKTTNGAGAPSAAQPEDTQSIQTRLDAATEGETPAPVPSAPEGQAETTNPGQKRRKAPNPAANRRRGKARTAAEQAEGTDTPTGQDPAPDGEIVPDGAASENAAHNSGERSTTAKKPRKPRKDKGVSKKKGAPDSGAAGAGGEDEGEGGQTPAVPKPRRQQKKAPPRKRIAENNNDGEGNGEREGGAEEEEESDIIRKPRVPFEEHLMYDEEDPDNPEKVRINEMTMPMHGLTKDIPTLGVPTQREDALSKINWEEEKRKRIEARERIAQGEEHPDIQAERAAAAEELQNAANAANNARQAAAGPRMRIVNGQMVLDASSTQVDRRALADEDEGVLLEVEENDLTNRVTNMSYIRDNKKDPRDRLPWGGRRADRWSEEENEEFYKALRMFGTDFFIISTLFPHKTRANVKRHFVKQEHLNPDRIKRALIGEAEPMDFEKYKAATGKEEADFRDPEALREELEEESRENRRIIEEAMAAKKEQERQRELAKAGGRGQDDGEGAKRKKKDKKKANRPMGGEEEVVVEMDGDEMDARPW
ncbi:hypothetical protein K490DRAFT_65443 [Saccharata proteae CBS 121410]|uniref:Myb-like domain-containing protein n=1 Tax=Saccharata proteae CBS 121410 TaxID=1314787 RepID=A0A9P4LXG3_9PEZI|nr:hypothetical protein K490DRAFT_65443 [Saccharata proteae CBS 121410]